MDFELGNWNDGTVRLYFAEHIHGEDLYFILDEDGKTYQAFPQEDGSETRTEIDLVKTLRALATQLCAAAEREQALEEEDIQDSVARVG